MRSQITAYLHADTKAWLRTYAKGCRLKESEVVRLLVEREEKARWLKWALSINDPGKGRSSALSRPDNPFTRHWGDPPQQRRGRKPANPR